MPPYRLRCQLLGHTADVRALAVTSEGQIITASRDTTARLWTVNQSNGVYEQERMYTGHSGYVTAVCVGRPSDLSSQDLVFTGSRDTTVRVYPVGSSEPVRTLTGHTDTVSCLAYHCDTLVSGSWDHSARVWHGFNFAYELKGHQGPLWAVAIIQRNEGTIILTASADKTIKCWKDGKEERIYKGHTDCVRGLYIVDENHFLSCSNDASIRLWSVSGECLAQFYGHTNFIYDVCGVGRDGEFISGGEDRSMCVWSKDGQCIQTIHLPAISVWCVLGLPNGDIVCGTSDGCCRVFSRVEERQVSEADQKAFDESVTKSTLSTDLGGVDKKSLPGPEALLAPGKKDGHTIMVREGDKVNCYSWSASEQKWSALGEVVGGAGGSAGTSGKVLYQGKEYDFVFDVDLDGENTLKLPYNVTEDPYFAAQRFIHQHELPQEHLEQVANFIINNTKGMTLGMDSSSSGGVDPFTGGSSYRPGFGERNTGGFPGGSDPFTGGGRYVPTGGVAPGAINGLGNINTDPLTGSSSYSTGGSSGTASVPLVSQFFPQRLPLLFEACNAQGMLTKLRECNGVIDPAAKMTDEQLETIVGVVTSPGEPNPQQVSGLEVALQWPAAQVWPALDLLRLALRSSTMQNSWLKQGNKGESVINLLVTLLRPPAPVNAQLMAMRCLANMAAHPPGRCILLVHREVVVSGIVGQSPYVNKNVEIAAATVLLNYSVLLTSDAKGDLEDQCQVLSGASAVALSCKESEAQFRAMVALGTLLCYNDECRALAQSLDLKPVAHSLASVQDPPKVGECAGHIAKML